MEILKVLLAAQTHNPQNGSHRSLSRCQDGSQQQDLYMLPNTSGKKSGKCRQDRGIFASQGGLEFGGSAVGQGKCKGNWRYPYGYDLKRKDG